MIFAGRIMSVNHNGMKGVLVYCGCYFCHPWWVRLS